MGILFYQYYILLVYHLHMLSVHFFDLHYTLQAFLLYQNQLEDVIDNICDRLQYSNDFYYEIFINPEYKQTSKYIFISLIFTMSEPEFYTESAEYKYDVPMLYWNCFKYIFSYCTESEEFLKIFLKFMYEIEDTNKHIQLLQEFHNNFELLDSEYFESTTKKQIISIMKDKIQIYKTVIAK